MKSKKIDEKSKEIKIKDILSYMLNLANNKNDINSLFKDSIEGIRKIIELDRVRLYLLSEDKNFLLGVYSTGKYIQQEEFKNIKVKIKNNNRFFKNDEVISEVIFNKKSKIFNFFSKDPLAKKLKKDKDTNFLGVPILIEDETIGMIIADNKVSKKEINSEQLELLEIFSKQIAYAFNSNKIYENYQKKLNDFNSIIEIASTLNKSNNLTEILDSILIRLVRKYNVSECNIYFLTKSKDKLKLMSSFSQIQKNNNYGFIDVNKNKTYQKAIKQKKIQYIENLSLVNNHKDKTLFETKNKSLVCIPILLDNKNYGIITIKTSKILYFDSNDYNYFYGISNQAAIAIKNAKLYDTLNKKINENKLLNKINNSITRVTDVLETVETLKVHLEKYHNAKVNVLFINENKILEKGKYYKINVGDYFYNTILSKKIKIIPDSKKYSYRRIDDKGIVLIPVFEEKKCKAILEIIESKITNEKKDFYYNLNEVLKVANHSKKLYDDIKSKNEEFKELNFKLDEQVKNLNLIQELNKKLSNIRETNKIIEFFFNYIKYLYPHEKVCIGFLDDKFPIFSDEGYDINTISQNSNAKQREKKGISFEAIKKSKPIICNDVSKSKNYLPVFKKVKSQISLPIFIRKKAIGFVTIESFEKDKFKDKDKVDTLKVLIDQIMITLDNVLLVQNLNKNSESLKKRIREIATISEIIKSIKKTDNIEKILDVVNKSVVKKLGYCSSQIKLFDKNMTGFKISRIIQTKKIKNQMNNIKEFDEFIISKIKNNFDVLKKDFITTKDLVKTQEDKDIFLKDKINKTIFLLKDKNKILGIFIIGVTYPDEISDNSINTFLDITNQIVIGIKDYNMINEIKNFGQFMKKEVNKKTNELQITNETLRKERNKIRNTIDLMADSLIVTDNKNKITMVNSSFENMTGLTRNKIKNKDFINVLKSLGAKKLSQEKLLENEIYLENIKKYINIRKTDLIEKEKDVGDIFILQDITKIKEINKIKNEFVSNVSHELRTPLTSILGYTKLLVSERLGALEEKQKDSLNIINDEAERLTRLINDVLDISKLEAGKLNFDFQPNDIKKLVQEVKNNFLALAQQNKIIFATRISKNVTSTAIFDYDRIKQVFINLLSNAFKFTDNNGKVTINVAQKKGLITCSITDSGQGIEKEDIPKLFNKFYQVDSSMTRKQGGSGLGLAISKDIIQKHNGTINVESKLGVGSTFKFEFPIIANKK